MLQCLGFSIFLGTLPTVESIHGYPEVHASYPFDHFISHFFIIVVSLKYFRGVFSKQ